MVQISVWAFILSGVLVALLLPLAPMIGLIDRPDARKKHTGAVPLVGGIAITASVVATLLISGALAFPQLSTLLIVGTILAALGLLDDYVDISARYRMLVQVGVGFALCFAADLQILTVGDLTGNGYVVLGGLASVLFTIACSVGVFNSINMIDGIDGLAGTLVVLSAGALAGFALSAQDHFSAGVLIAIVSATLAYLLFNLSVFGSKLKVFMGDAGSMFLGFVLLWFFISLSQGDNAPMSPVVAGWIFGLPLADTVSVIVGRLSRGEHPFSAGRDHIHHRLLHRGFSSRRVLIILASYHGLLVCIGVVGNGTPGAEPFLFWGFVALTVVHFFISRKLLPHDRSFQHGEDAAHKAL